MAAPKGFLVVPIGENPDGDLRMLELTADDFLRVNVEGGTLTVAKHNILDGDVHGDSVVKAVTRGGILVGSSAPAWDRLDIGANDSVLASDGTDLAYETLASLLQSALFTANGDLLIRNASGTVIRLPAGTANQILGLAAGIPSWQDGSKKTLTAAGDILYASAANTLARLAKGSDGEVLTLASGIPSWAAATGGYTEGARVYDASVQSIPDATWTSVAFDSERFDTDSIHDTVTNNSRLTCKTAGKYLICFSLGLDANATGGRAFRVFLNNTDSIAEEQRDATAETGWGSYSVSATIYDLAINDYVEAQVYQNSGGNLDTIQAGNYTPEFMMQRIG